MAGAYVATNLIDSSSSITVSSEDSDYPKTNLYDKQAARVFRCQSGTALTILIDLLSAREVSAVALVNHNLTASATLNLKAGESSPPTVVVATPTYRQHDLWKSLAPTTARYWLLTIADTNSDPIQIGQMILGEYVTLPRGRRIGAGYKPAVKRSNISGETYAGVFWNYHLFQRHEFNPSFRVGSAAELEVISDLDEAVHGNLWPFLYVPNVSGSDCYYVRKEENYEPNEYDERVAGPELVHDYQMILTEESRGLEILE